MASKVRFHAYVSASAATAQEMVLYADGDDSTLTVGANDWIELDTIQLIVAAGVGTMMFRATAGAFDAESVVSQCRHVAGPIFMDFRPTPRRGVPGDKLFVISDGANITTGIATGWLYRG